MNAIHKLAQTSLSTVELEALAELKRRLLAEFDFVEQLILFGSAARGTADEESDIDLLVLTKCRLPNSLRHQITYMVFDLNLEYETNFTTLVIPLDEWNTGLVSVLPIKLEIDREGIML